MVLPVSTRAPSPAPRLIDPASFKSSFDLTVPGLDKPMQDLVCGTVFNTLSLKVNGNPLRTFTYNIMAKGDYRSDEFKELCNFSGNYALLQYGKELTRRGRNEKEIELNNLTVAIQREVPLAITQWMSKLLFQYSDMEYEIGSDVAHKAKQVNKVYQNSLKEIQAMSIDANKMAMIMAAIGGQQNQQSDATSILAALGVGEQMVNVPINGQMVQLPMSQVAKLRQMLGGQQNNNSQAAIIQQLLGNGGGGNQSSSNPVAALLSSLTGGGGNNGGNISLTGNFTGQTIPAIAAANQNQGSSRLITEWKKSRGEIVDTIEIGEPTTESNAFNLTGSNFTSNDVKKEAQVAKPQSKANDVVKGDGPSRSIKPLFIKGGSEHSYATHDISALGSDIIAQDRPVYRELNKACARVLRSTPDEPYFTVEAVGVEGTDEYKASTEGRGSVMISKDIQVSNTVAGVIAMGIEFHRTQLAQFPATKEDICVVFGIATNPIYHVGVDSRELFESCMERLTTPQQLRMRMENAGNGVRELSRANRITSSSEVQELLRDVETLDRWLTQACNDFMENCLGDTTSIDNFTTDFSELEVYIAKNHGNRGTVAFDEYMDTMLASLREGRSSLILEHLELVCVSLSMAVSALAETSVMSMLPYTESELGIRIGREIRYINPELNTVLTDVCKSMDKSSERMELPMMNKYIITRDNSIFRITNAPTFREGRGFMIQRYQTR